MIALLIGAMALPVHGQADRAPRWNLRADPGLCVLERRDPESSATLSIKTVPGSDDYLVAIVTPTLKKTASLAPGSLTFAPSQKSLNGLASAAKLADGSRILWMQGIAPALLDDLSGTDSVTLAIRSGESISVRAPGSAKAVAALRRCSADQLIEWGADAGQFARGGTTPIAVKDRDQWLSKSELLGVMGKSTRSDVDDMFRVAISTEGVVEACQASSDKTGKGVEKAVCKAVLGKPLFTAAKDPGGRAVRGVATFRVLLASRPF